jgi:hypothetical protein
MTSVSSGSAAAIAVEDLAMLPWTSVRSVLSDRALRVRLLAPPYPALGVGALRCLRLVPLTGRHDGAWELTVGYDGYERL